MRDLKTYSENHRRLLTNLLFLFLISYLVLFFIHKISFFENADIGRHLKNGELVFEHPELLTTNFYSYTEPNFPVLNHHAGSGIIYFKIVKLFGFKGLVLFNCLLMIFVFWFLFQTTPIRSNLLFFSLIVLVSIPILTNRNMVRPEVFSYFFIALFLFLIHQFKNHKLKFWIFTLIFLVSQMVWTNLHVYFIFGPFLIGLYALETIINNGLIKNLKFVLLTIIILLVTLVNPFGIDLLKEIFTLKNSLVLVPEEAKHLFHFEHYSNFSQFTPRYIFDLMSLSVIVLSLASIIRKSFFTNFTINISTLTFLAFAWLMNRNIALFGFAYIPFIMTQLQEFKKIKPKIILNAFLLVISIILFTTPFYRPSKIGLGLIEDEHKAATFIKDHHLKDPVFNNFDIGSYLTYHFYPELKPFIDPRPEAYSDSFSRNAYWAIKQNFDSKTWEQALKDYGFQTIIISNNEIFQQNGFIQERLKDPLWRKVYEDEFVIVFCK